MAVHRGRRIATHVAAFVAGVATAVAVVGEAREAKSRFRTLDAFAHSISLIRRNHVEKVSERQLVYAAVEGMVTKLDEHSSFYSPRRYRRLREDTHGEFGGVGLTLRRADKAADPPFPVVADIISGSPSHQAGIAVGSELLSIDGQPTATTGQKKRRGRSFHTILRGPSKSKVTLEIRNDSSTRTIELIRERVKVPSVEAIGFGDGIVLARIRRFQEATPVDLAKAIKKMTEGEPRGVLLDLRNNPGGLFDQAVVVADLFLRKGTIVQVIGRGKRLLERPEARVGGGLESVPVAVIVDGNTASAAEIVAGALKDNRRAALFGKRTFGKGSVQTFYDLPDGAGLKLTTARYVSPSGTVIHGSGIEPTHEVEAFAGDTFVVGGGPEGPPGASLRKRWPHLTAELAERLDADLQLLEAYSSLAAPGSR